MTTLVERQQILDQLSTLAMQDIERYWRGISDSVDAEFRAIVAEAFPELLAPYSAAAAELGAEWYAESAPGLPYQPTSFLPATEGLAQSTAWALSATGEAALPRLAGITQRQVFQANRETIIGNSNRETGSTWARVARPGACAFCAMLATRSDVYASRAAALTVVGRGKDVSTNFRADGSKKSGGQAKGVKTRGGQKVGDKFHDNCHCQAKEVRPGQSYSPPDYVQKWQDAYTQATRETEKVGKYGALDPTAILAHMRQNLGTH